MLKYLFAMPCKPNQFGRCVNEVTSPNTVYVVNTKSNTVSVILGWGLTISAIHLLRSTLSYFYWIWDILAPLVQGF